MCGGNIYAAIPDHLPEEIVQKLVDSRNVRIERIVSDSHCSPEGFWHDQAEAEFVLLLEGSAALKFEGTEELCLMKPGDWISIPANLKHRVEWTDPEKKTVWLAVFY